MNKQKTENISPKFDDEIWSDWTYLNIYLKSKVITKQNFALNLNLRCSIRESVQSLKWGAKIWRTKWDSDRKSNKKVSIANV